MTHEVAVRDATSTANPRRGHLCPVQGIAIPCPVYAAGVERYAEAVARDVGDVMEQTVPVRRCRTPADAERTAPASRPAS
jgi:hypothetical protein